VCPPIVGSPEGRTSIVVLAAADPAYRPSRDWIPGCDRGTDRAAYRSRASIGSVVPVRRAGSADPGHPGGGKRPRRGRHSPGNVWGGALLYIPELHGQGTVRSGVSVSPTIHTTNTVGTGRLRPGGQVGATPAGSERPRPRFVGSRRSGVDSGGDGRGRQRSGGRVGSTLPGLWRSPGGRFALPPLWLGRRPGAPSFPPEGAASRLGRPSRPVVPSGPPRSRRPAPVRAHRPRPRSADDPAVDGARR